MHRLVITFMAALLVMGWLFTATPAWAQSELEGVWEQIEVSGHNEEGDWERDNIQPGLMIFHDGYFSRTVVTGNEARPLMDEDETLATLADEKLRAIVLPFGGQAGTYEISGSTLTRTVVAAKNPNIMQGDPLQNMTFSMDGDVLTIRADLGDGYWREEKWRRLR